MGVRRRNTELGLLVMAVVIIGAAYTLATPGGRQAVPRQHRAVPADRAGPAARRPPRGAPPGPRPPTRSCCRWPRCSTARLRGHHHPPIRRAAPARAPGRPPGGVDRRRHRRLHRSRWSSCAGPRSSRATATRSPSSASACSCCRWCPHIGRTVNGSQIWVEHRADQLPARRDRQDRAGHLLRRPTWSRSASCWPCARGRLGPFNLPEPKHLGPVLRGLGHVAHDHGVAERPRLVAAVLHAVRRDAVGGHRADVLPGGRRAACSARRAYVSWQPVRPRAGARHHLAQPVAATRPATASRSCKAAFAMANGGLTGTGLGPRQPGQHPRTSRPTSSSRRSARSSACSAPPLVHRRLHADRRLGPAHRRPRRPRLRQAAGRRPHHAASACRRSSSSAGVTRLLPAHRRDPAVRVLRRLVARVELRSCSRCCCGSPTSRTAAALERGRPVAVA